MPVRPEVSATSLELFRKCEILFRDRDSDTTAPTEHELIGQAAHCLILEGRFAYEQRFGTGPVNPKTGKQFGLDTKAVQEWQFETGKTAITESARLKIESMRDSVWGHVGIRDVLADGQSEVFVEEEYCGLTCRGYVDRLGMRRITDLKTCDDLDSFESNARRFHYANQIAFYRSIVSKNLETEPHVIECYMAAVEKKAPFRAGLWRIGQDVLAQATKENEALLRRLKVCLETDTWRTGYEKTRQFDWLY